VLYLSALETLRVEALYKSTTFTFLLHLNKMFPSLAVAPVVYAFATMSDVVRILDSK